MKKKLFPWASLTLLAMVFVPLLWARSAAPGRDRDHKAYYNMDSGAGAVAITSNTAIRQYGTIGENNQLSSSTVNGTLSVSGALTQTGAISSAGGLTQSAGLHVQTPAAFTIGAATEIVPTSSFITVVTTGTGAITWACTNSCISTSVANGTQLEVMSSTTTNITWTDSAFIQLSTTATSTTRVFSNPGDNITLRLLSGVWYEVAFSTGHE